MIDRMMEKALLARAGEYPAVTITGPRQSGKTTLARKVFPDYDYVSLENPDERTFALEDPKGFLNRFTRPVIMDEIQRAPELFSYLQGRMDADGRPGRYVLTGSQNFLLMEKVSQSLAGRTALFHLLPFSRAELLGRQPMALKDIGHKIPEQADAGASMFHTFFRGFYPRIHDKNLDPQDWLRNYFHTYIERDVRNIVQVGDIEAFGRFVRLCAGRAGQLLNLSALGVDCGVSHATARRWISVLETSFIVYLLRPHYENFSRRQIKSPKLYFLDTGLLCYLLRVRSPRDVATHPARGALFESFVLGELLKCAFNQGRDADLYFWRDVGGHEVDFVVEADGKRVPVEAKSGETLPCDFLRGIQYWRGLSGRQETPAAVVYGGESSMMRSDTAVYSWRDWL